jgi:hypothetical protein
MRLGSESECGGQSFGPPAFLDGRRYDIYRQSFSSASAKFNDFDVF